jgi:hypothetical protein
METLIILVALATIAIPALTEAAAAATHLFAGTFAEGGGAAEMARKDWDLAGRLGDDWDRKRKRDLRSDPLPRGRVHTIQ